MKLINLGKVLTGIFSLFLTISFAQEDTVNVNQQEERPVVEPKAQSGNLDMLTPPATFEISPAFNGFLSKKTSSAIIVTLINDVTFPLLAKGMDEEFYKKNNLTFISESDVVTDTGSKGVLYKLSFILEGDVFIRYMVYIGDLEKTLWLNITYPQIVESVVESEILKCITTVNLNPVRDEK